jgi:hypothetical protein
MAECGSPNAGNHARPFNLLSITMHDPLRPRSDSDCRKVLGASGSTLVTPALAPSAQTPEVCPDRCTRTPARPHILFQLPTVNSDVRNLMPVCQTAPPFSAHDERFDRFLTCYFCARIVMYCNVQNRGDFDVLCSIEHANTAAGTHCWQIHSCHCTSYGCIANSYSKDDVHCTATAVNKLYAPLTMQHQIHSINNPYLC